MKKKKILDETGRPISSWGIVHGRFKLRAAYKDDLRAAIDESAVIVQNVEEFKILFRIYFSNSY